MSPVAAAVVEHSKVHEVVGFFCPPPQSDRLAALMYLIGHAALYPGCPWRMPDDAE